MTRDGTDAGTDAAGEIVEGGFYGPRSEAWRLNRNAQTLAIETATGRREALPRSEDP